MAENVPILGWKVHQWGGPKRPCAVGCGRRVRGGIVHPNNPDGKVICHWCFQRIMSEPAPEDWGSQEGGPDATMEVVTRAVRRLKREREA